MELRAFALPPASDDDEKKKRKGRRVGERGSENVLVIDCETTTDLLSLTFGAYQYLGPGGVIEEGLFHADDLAETDPAGYQELVTYIANHHGSERSAARYRHLGPRKLRLITRREFVDRVFYMAAYKTRARVVAFNMPFDLSRLALDAAPSKKTPGAFALTMWDRVGGDGRHYAENLFRPKIVVKRLDSRKSFVEFTSAKDPDVADEDIGEDGRKIPFRGRFLDLKTLMFALTSEGHNLKSACKAMGLPPELQKGSAEQHGVITQDYIGYCRQDVTATVALYHRAIAELRLHPIDLEPERCYSPASIGKAYMRAMGVDPILERQPGFSREVLGRAMQMYFGGRAESRIPRVVLPCTFVDFLSMYTSVDLLLRVWSIMTAEVVDVVDATEEVRQLVERVRVEGADLMFDPEVWAGLVGLVEVDPNGAVLPVRGRYTAVSTNIGINELSSLEPLWYTLPDVIAAELLSPGRLRVLSAVRIVPGHPRDLLGRPDTSEPPRRQPGLRPVRMRGAVEVDPTEADFFRTVIEQRVLIKRGVAETNLKTDERARMVVFLKCVASSTAYGVAAEFNVSGLGRGERADVDLWGWDGEQPVLSTTASVEKAGRYAFPPVAACITGAARLMLALLERCVADAGGSYLTVDTDSMTIVSTRDGGLLPCPGGDQELDGQPAVRALSWDQVDAIVERFSLLNPYDRTAVPGSILKHEDVNYENPDDPSTRRQVHCLSISTKRYAIFTLTAGGDLEEIAKYSEHGLGHLLSPEELKVGPNGEEKRRPWIRDLWAYLIRRQLGRPAPAPAWWYRQAVGRMVVSSSEQLAAVDSFNRTADGALKPYADRIKPFSFMITAKAIPLFLPEDVDRDRLALVAPFSSTPSTWPRLPWFNLYTGERHSVEVFRGWGDGSAPRRGALLVRSYQHAVSNYGASTEHKFNGPDGAPCAPGTRGVLQRKHVHALYRIAIGKESNRMEEVAAGMVRDQGEVRTTYQDQRGSWGSLVLPVLMEMPIEPLAETTGVPVRSVVRWRRGSIPRAALMTRAVEAVAAHARSGLVAAHLDAPAGDLEALYAFLAATSRGQALPVPTAPPNAWGELPRLDEDEADDQEEEYELRAQVESMREAIGGDPLSGWARQRGRSRRPEGVDAIAHELGWETDYYVDRVRQNRENRQEMRELYRSLRRVRDRRRGRSAEQRRLRISSEGRRYLATSGMPFTVLRAWEEPQAPGGAEWRFVIEFGRNLRVILPIPATEESRQMAVSIMDRLSTGEKLDGATLEQRDADACVLVVPAEIHIEEAQEA